jgi:transposase-like protein
MARSSYPPETKAAVVAALLEGQAASKVAADYKLPEGTVKAWGSRLRNNGSELQSVATEKKDEIGELLVRYLHANLTTLEAQNVVFRDPTWLTKQNAADVAVLHGVLTDKAVRLLEALGPPGDE